MKSICIFLGSNIGAAPVYGRAAQAMGREMARRDLTCVYGGSNTGLMKQLADAALDAGGQVVGVTVKALKDKEIFHPGLSELHVVETMQERKHLMAELADGFIALPGGIGTLEELFEMLTLNLLEFQTKPCGLLNINHYWDHLNLLLDHVAREGFLKISTASLMLQSESPETLLDIFMEQEEETQAMPMDNCRP